MILTPENLAERMLCFPCSVQRLPNGNTLIADAGDEESRGSKVIEVDAYGDIVWMYGESLCFAHAAERLDSGNTVIADTNNNRIIEVDGAGKTVFSSESWGSGSGQLTDGSHLDYPNDVHAVWGETLLVTDRNNNRVVLVDRQGTLLQVYSDGLVRPHNGGLLANGNLLVANSERQEVVELTPQSHVVWRYDGNAGQALAWPRDAERLPDGSTLITDSKNARVLRVNRAGRTLWEYCVPYFANFFEADWLTNGHVLISDQQHKQVIEVDDYGNIVWAFRNHALTRPIEEELVNGTLRGASRYHAPDGWYLNTRLAEGGGHIIIESNAETCGCTGIEYDREGMLYLQQTVGAKAGTACLLSGELRTEKLESGCACLQLAYVDAYGGYMGDVLSQPSSALLQGRSDWTGCLVQATAPENATAIEVRVLITGPGRVFARNLRLTK